jgi:hypothetical protein
LDGTKVTVYAQWRNKEDLDAMLRARDVFPYMKKALEIAKFEGHVYEVKFSDEVRAKSRERK